LFALFSLLPALASAKADSAALATQLQRRFFLLTIACGVVGAVSALVSLLAKAEIATALPPSDLLSGAVLEPLLQAWSGTVWLLREAVFALMAVAALVG